MWSAVCVSISGERAQIRSLPFNSVINLHQGRNKRWHVLGCLLPVLSLLDQHVKFCHFPLWLQPLENCNTWTCNNGMYLHSTAAGHLGGAHYSIWWLLVCYVQSSAGCQAVEVKGAPVTCVVNTSVLLPNKPLKQCVVRTQSLIRCVKSTGESLMYLICGHCCSVLY